MKKKNEEIDIDKIVDEKIDAEMKNLTISDLSDIVQSVLFRIKDRADRNTVALHMINKAIIIAVDDLEDGLEFLDAVKEDYINFLASLENGTYRQPTYSNNFETAN